MNPILNLWADRFHWHRQAAKIAPTDKGIAQVLREYLHTLGQFEAANARLKRNPNSIPENDRKNTLQLETIDRLITLTNAVVIHQKNQLEKQCLQPSA